MAIHGELDKTEGTTAPERESPADGILKAGNTLRLPGRTM